VGHHTADDGHAADDALQQDAAGPRIEIRVGRRGKCPERSANRYTENREAEKSKHKE
jgi:hypothetical protein